jgi:predicted DCC family thiol-disulfide oxidoreductase YuxK
MERIILFDGVCNFCSGAIQFIIKRDPKAHFKFASLQGEVGRGLLKQFNLNDSMTTLVLIEGNQYFTRSTAALRICKKLTGGYPILSFLHVIPRPLRDFVYNYVAKNRYRWFGQKSSCFLPTPAIKKRFLD